MRIRGTINGTGDVISAVPSLTTTEPIEAAPAMASSKSTKTERQLRRALQALIDEVSCCLVSIDQTMVGPSTPERGRRIGQACSALQYARDYAAHFELGHSFEKIKRDAAKAVKRRIEAQR